MCVTVYPGTQTYPHPHLWNKAITSNTGELDQRLTTHPALLHTHLWALWESSPLAFNSTWKQKWSVCIYLCNSDYISHFMFLLIVIQLYVTRVLMISLFCVLKDWMFKNVESAIFSWDECFGVEEKKRLNFISAATSYKKMILFMFNTRY